MAGVSDLPFRQICRHFGAGLTTAEMLTADSRLWSSRKSQQRLQIDANSSLPNSMQIVGFDASMLADAANKAIELGAEIVDINMGCPAKKVCKRAAGSALLKDEALVADILQQTVKVAHNRAQVTLKIRTGWDEQHKNAVNVAKIAESEGISALTIHGRTRACRFNGEAEFETIAQVKQQVGIPIIANGDITGCEKAIQVLKQTGADGIMIGRGAQGKPWIFRQLQQALKGEQVLPITLEEKKNCIISHVKALHDFYGEHMGHKIARKHVGWYFDELGLPSYKKAFNRLDCPQEQITFINQIISIH